jgi:hypothetical protein
MGPDIGRDEDWGEALGDRSKCHTVSHDFINALGLFLTESH